MVADPLRQEQQEQEQQPQQISWSSSLGNTAEQQQHKQQQQRQEQRQREEDQCFYPSMFQPAGIQQEAIDVFDRATNRVQRRVVQFIAHETARVNKRLLELKAKQEELSVGGSSDSDRCNKRRRLEEPDSSSSSSNPPCHTFSTNDGDDTQDESKTTAHAVADPQVLAVLYASHCDPASSSNSMLLQVLQQRQECLLQQSNRSRRMIDLLQQLEHVQRELMDEMMACADDADLHQEQEEESQDQQEQSHC